jgi:hypothetical protein
MISSLRLWPLDHEAGPEGDVRDSVCDVAQNRLIGTFYGGGDEPSRVHLHLLVGGACVKRFTSSCLSLVISRVHRCSWLGPHHAELFTLCLWRTFAGRCNGTLSALWAWRCSLCIKLECKDRQSCGVVTPLSGCLKTGHVLLDFRGPLQADTGTVPWGGQCRFHIRFAWAEVWYENQCLWSYLKKTPVRRASHST